MLSHVSQVFGSFKVRKLQGREGTGHAGSMPEAHRCTSPLSAEYPARGKIRTWPEMHREPGPGLLKHTAFYHPLPLAYIHARHHSSNARKGRKRPNSYWHINRPILILAQPKALIVACKPHQSLTHQSNFPRAVHHSVPSCSPRCYPWCPCCLRDPCPSCQQQIVGRIRPKPSVGYG